MGVALLPRLLITLLEGDGRNVRGNRNLLTALNQVIKFFCGKALPLVIAFSVCGDRDGQDAQVVQLRFLLRWDVTGRIGDEKNLLFCHNFSF